MAEAPLLNQTFLFRFEIVIKQHSLRWTATGLQLDEDFRLPCFGVLGTGNLMESGKAPVQYADVRMAWDASGLGFWMQTSGKKQLPWCRDSRTDDSDGLQLWIDTRNSPGIHRANRFCHRFLFSPFGGGPRRDQPMAQMIPIHRARQEPNSIDPKLLNVFGKPLSDGYEMSGLIPNAALTGFDPVEYPKISLWYNVIDRELGNQAFSLNSSYPCPEDPSLWGSAVLG